LRSPKGIESLGSPVFIFAVALLVLNDFVFKAAFHNWLTGKLSDFAGLAAFTIFVCAFWPDRKRTIAVGVSAAFIFWKSPGSQGLIDWVNAVSPVPFGRTVDYTDLIALPVVWLVCARAPLRAWPARRWLLQALAGVSVVAFTATSMATYRYEISEAADFSGAARGGAASDEAELQQLVDDVAARHKLRCHDCSPLSSGRSYLEDATRGLGLSLRVGFDPLGKRLFYDLSSVTEGSPPPPRQPVDALRADLEQALRSRFPGVTVTAASLPHTENVTLVLTSRSSSGSSGSAENQFDSERAFAIVAEVAAEQGLKRVGDARFFYAGRLLGPYQRELTVIMQVWAEPLVEIHVRCASPECRERQLAVARALERRLQMEFGKERAAIRPGP
jgi:hypothetical protein